MHHPRNSKVSSAIECRYQNDDLTSTEAPRDNRRTNWKFSKHPALHKPKPKPKPFRFLDLLGELRNLVYSFCLPEDEYTTDQTTDWTKERKRHSTKGLLGVSGQVRNEFRPLYWSVHGPLIQHHKLPHLMKVFFSENTTDSIVPPWVTMVHHDYYVAGTRLPGDIVYDLLPVIKAQKRIPSPKWQVLITTFPNAEARRAAQAHGWSHQGHELQQCFQAIIGADWSGMLANTRNMTLESCTLRHSVGRYSNTCRFKLQTPNDSVNEQEEDALAKHTNSVHNAMYLESVPHELEYIKSIKPEILDVRGKRVWDTAIEST